MNRELLYFLALGTTYLLLFGIAELLYRKARWEAEHTRKLVHVVSGILALTFPLFFESHWWVLALCSSFLILLLCSKRYDFLPSINAVERKTYGSDLFPIAVYFLFLVYQSKQNSSDAQPLFWYYHPLLLLALCDPIAALVGRNFPWKPIQIFGHTKTISGALGFFAGAVMITCILMAYLGRDNSGVPFVVYVLTLGILTAISEFISTKGLDNFVIVLVATGVNYIFLN